MSWYTSIINFDTNTLCVNCGERYGDHYGKICPSDHRSSTSLKHDPVSHPAHYTSGGIECIDALKAALTWEEFQGFCKGNVLKYVWRANLKGGDEDLKKALWYLDHLINP